MLREILSHIKNFISLILFASEDYIHEKIVSAVTWLMAKLYRLTTFYTDELNNADNFKYFLHGEYNLVEKIGFHILIPGFIGIITSCSIIKFLNIYNRFGISLDDLTKSIATYLHAVVIFLIMVSYFVTITLLALFYSIKLNAYFRKRYLVEVIKYTLISMLMIYVINLNEIEYEFRYAAKYIILLSASIFLVGLIIIVIGTLFSLAMCRNDMIYAKNKCAKSCEGGNAKDEHVAYQEICKLIDSGGFKVYTGRSKEEVKKEYADVLLSPWIPTSWYLRIVFLLLIIFGYYGYTTNNTLLLHGIIIAPLLSPKYVQSIMAANKASILLNKKSKKS